MSDVFIIGAGCSVPYGFPTGAMLMQNLKNFDYGRKFPRKNYSDGDIFLVDYIRGYETVTECRQGRLGRTNSTKKSIFSVGKSEPLYSLTLARNYFALKTQKRYNI